MNIIEIIAKKRDKKKLSKEEIQYFIKEYTNNNVTDYQASALVMAIYINGMDAEETKELTLAMANSGEKLDLSMFGENVVDKHSTGGVGDKVSLILLPIIASLEIPVAKMSGRGLGFTGGTIDKLESIKGYRTDIEINQFIENVKNIGISLIGQTLNLAPADKKIYALRDTIACTDSIPLIASSIMSKKIAAGANKIVLDVTCGHGAFMKNIEDARKLAIAMKEIGKLANKETVCVITNMNEPLGYAVGNNLEVIEAIECLKGNMPEDVEKVVLELGAYMVKLAGKGENIEENKERIKEVIANGKAYEKFIQLIENQCGDISYVNDTSKFEKSKYVLPVTSKSSGYIQDINARRIGEISGMLGAGRIRKEDSIDNTVGIVLEKKVADYIEVGDTLAYVHANSEELAKQAIEQITKEYVIAQTKIDKPEAILEII